MRVTFRAIMLLLMGLSLGHSVVAEGTVAIVIRGDASDEHGAALAELLTAALIRENIEIGPVTLLTGLPGTDLEVRARDQGVAAFIDCHVSVEEDLIIRISAVRVSSMTEFFDSVMKSSPARGIGRGVSILAGHVAAETSDLFARTEAQRDVNEENNQALAELALEALSSRLATNQQTRSVRVEDSQPDAAGPEPGGISVVPREIQVPEMAGEPVAEAAVADGPRVEETSAETPLRLPEPVPEDGVRAGPLPEPLLEPKPEPEPEPEPEAEPPVQVEVAQSSAQDERETVRPADEPSPPDLDIRIPAATADAAGRPPPASERWAVTLGIGQTLGLNFAGDAGVWYGSVSSASVLVEFRAVRLGVLSLFLAPAAAYRFEYLESGDTPTIGTVGIVARTAVAGLSAIVRFRSGVMTGVGVCGVYPLAGRFVTTAGDVQFGAEQRGVIPYVCGTAGYLISAGSNWSVPFHAQVAVGLGVPGATPIEVGGGVSLRYSPAR